MYYEHFGFKCPPFKITPDTSLFFPGGNRGAILEALAYAVHNGEGIIKVVGEVGSGKTMLCRMLELELPSHIEIVYLGNPRVLPEHILHAIAFELKLPIRDEDNQLLVLQKIQDYLLERHADNRQVVMFVEEAQSMPLATLEEIRLLSNLETNQNKLLQIVLFGQPELDDMLAKPQIRQLKERITYNFRLEPLRRGEIRDYINARLHSCGYRGNSLFAGGAITRITRYSRGLLRRVNILADKSLLAAYAKNSPRVHREHVIAAARDSDFHPAWTRWLLWPAALVLLAAVGGLLYHYHEVQFSWLSKLTVVPVAEQAAVAADDSEPVADDNSAGPSEPETVDVATDRSGPARRIELGLKPLAEGFAWHLDAGFGGSNTNNAVIGFEPVAVPPAGIVEHAPETTGLREGRLIVANSITKTLRQQLQKLPPEEVWLDAPSEPGVTCDQCTAIIYRLFQDTEKL